MTYGVITFIGAAIVLVPNAPLIAILVGTQVLNAVLLIPLLFAMIGLGRDRALMGRFAIGPRATIGYGVTTAGVWLWRRCTGITTLVA